MSRRNTGPSPKVRQEVIDRANGRCERCACVLLSGGEIHHKRPRQMGGTRRPEVNEATSLALLCRCCHHHVESHRREAYRDGWLIRSGITNYEEDEVA